MSESSLERGRNETFSIFLATRLISGLKTFVDTNVLPYGLDGKDIQKRDIARKSIVEGRRGGKGIMSFQVMNEYAISLTIDFGRSPSDVSRLCAEFFSFRGESESVSPGA